MLLYAVQPKNDSSGVLFVLLNYKRLEGQDYRFNNKILDFKRNLQKHKQLGIFLEIGRCRTRLSILNFEAQIQILKIPDCISLHEKSVSSP